MERGGERGRKRRDGGERGEKKNGGRKRGTREGWGTEEREGGRSREERVEELS